MYFESVFLFIFQIYIPRSGIAGLDFLFNSTSPILHSLKFHKDTVLFTHLLTLALAGWLGSGKAHRCSQMAPATFCPPTFWLLLVFGCPAWHYREQRKERSCQGKVLPGKACACKPSEAFPVSPLPGSCLLHLHPAGKQIQLVICLFYEVLPLVFQPPQGKEHHELKTIKRHKPGIGNDGQFLESAIKCQFEEPQLTLGPEDHLWGSVTRRGTERSSYSLQSCLLTKAQTIQAPSSRPAVWVFMTQLRPASLVCLFSSCSLAVGGLQGGLRCLPGDRGVLSAWLRGTSSVVGLAAWA